MRVRIDKNGYESYEKMILIQNISNLRTMSQVSTNVFALIVNHGHNNRHSLINIKVCLIQRHKDMR